MPMCSWSEKGEGITASSTDAALVQVCPMLISMLSLLLLANGLQTLLLWGWLVHCRPQSRQGLAVHLAFQPPRQLLCAV